MMPATVQVQVQRRLHCHNAMASRPMPPHFFWSDRSFSSGGQYRPHAGTYSHHCLLLVGLTPTDSMLLVRAIEAKI